MFRAQFYDYIIMKRLVFKTYLCFFSKPFLTSAQAYCITVLMEVFKMFRLQNGLWLYNSEKFSNQNIYKYLLENISNERTSLLHHSINESDKNVQSTGYVKMKNIVIKTYISIFSKTLPTSAPAYCTTVLMALFKKLYLTGLRYYDRFSVKKVRELHFWQGDDRRPVS